MRAAALTIFLAGCSEVQPAINAERLAGNISGLRRGQERRRAGDLPVSPEAPERNLRERGGARRCAHRLSHYRLARRLKSG